MPPHIGAGSPEVSVVIPAYNAERWIRTCVESVLASRYGCAEMELICVDNGSSDRTLAILQSFGDAIRVLQASVRGPGAARNVGLHGAVGTYVAFTDADCIVDAEWLPRLIAPLRSGAACVTGGRILARPEAAAIERFGELVHDHRRAIEEDAPPYLIGMNMASRRDTLLSIGGFDERWLRGEDVVIAYQLLAAGRRLAYCGDAIVFHHNRDTLRTLAREAFLHGYYGPSLRREYGDFVASYRRNLGSSPAEVARTVEEPGAQAQPGADEPALEVFSRSQARWLVGRQPVCRRPSPVSANAMPQPVEVDVVICTRDRSEPLERLLTSVFAQQTGLAFRVTVVDNNPSPDRLRPVRERFAQVRWIEEPRRGLSWARNAGIGVAEAPVVVFADDDMEVAPGWLEAMARPVLAGEFDVVAGPVKPLRLETEAERLFEAYGAHGHQDTRAMYDGAWLRSKRWSLALWQVGGIGNSAVRREMFSEGRAGYFEEALGAGTPAGSFEDLYFLYRLLRAGGRVLREPAATVRHGHRDTMADLTRQLKGYRRGEVCFCLLVLLRHADVRGLTHIGCFVPAWRTRQFLDELGRRVRGKRLFSLRLMLQELAAYLGAPAALVRSLRRASRLRKEAR